MIRKRSKIKSRFKWFCRWFPTKPFLNRNKTNLRFSDHHNLLFAEVIVYSFFIIYSFIVVTFLLISPDYGIVLLFTIFINRWCLLLLGFIAVLPSCIQVFGSVNIIIIPLLPVSINLPLKYLCYLLYDKLIYCTVISS